MSSPIESFHRQASIEQDSADGEFSQLKTRLGLHLKRHVEETEDYIEVTDSDSLQKFGEQQMSKPGAKAKIDNRVFFSANPQEFKDRKQAVGRTPTLAGIKSKFEYVAFPSGKVCVFFCVFL